ncbi:MAG: long-chain fatty acid--CoA ligase [Betaproteobacteria bacterium]|nr:long-chain fatty acid--CoA ligase [Betaproteobacteria bacterium]
MTDALHRITQLRNQTAPGLLALHARAKPASVAFRSKHLGLYRERTWRDYSVLAGRAAQTLAKLGLSRGERIAIMGDACEEWIVIDQAAQALGAIVYGIYPTASIAELEFQMVNGGATIFVAENQQYVDKILPIVARLPCLRHIVVIDTTAMFSYAHPMIASYSALTAAANLTDDRALALFAHHAAQISPADPAFIVYTSGTTGHPKGALITHGRHLAACATIVEHYPTLAQQAHRTVVYLPLCHILGRDVAVTMPLISGVVPHFGESVDALGETFFDVAPTLLFTVPRYLQKFASQVLVSVGSSSKAKRAVYEWAMDIGRRHARDRWERGCTSTIAYEVARAMAFKPLLNKLGLDQLELVIAGGAAMPTETTALWQIWGVNVVEIYGQTEEAGAIIAGQTSPFPRPGNVGTPATGVDIKLDDDGQILVRTLDHFEGYWENDTATGEVLGDDGWIRTGDIGEWMPATATNTGERGASLRLVDRARDFIVTTGGKTLSPSFIENLLRSSPYIGEAIVFGHNRKYLTALIEIDFDTVADWARTHGILYTGFANLIESARVVQLMQSEIDKANAELARVETIKAFRILPKTLDPEEEGEPVTPTRKVKRTLMYQRFEALIESMYDDREERLVAAGAGDVLR